jgi:hypothetical protein
MAKAKSKPKIEHIIIEKTDYIMPIFFLILNLSFFIIISYLAGITLYTKTNSEMFTTILLALFWFIWILGIIKNKAWRPEKVKTIEHVIKEDIIKKKNIFEILKWWKKI